MSEIQNPFLTAQSTQIKSVISVPIKDFIHHYPRALFNDIPRVIKNHYLIQKQNPLYLLLVLARLIKYTVKTKHVSIRTSKSKAYRKIQIANNKLIKNHLNC